MCLALILMSLSAACTSSPTEDVCVWVRAINTHDAVVIGSSTYRDGDIEGRDVLTPGTAGRIAAHNAAVESCCG
jgi:hypothetical protein